MENEEVEKFEAFCSSIKLKQKYATWYPDLNRYTAFTIKQLMWETWNAAKGIPYVYNNGYK